MTATEASAAIGQRSLGDPSLLFPLYPPLLAGCPRSSGEGMQYPLEIDYDYSKISKNSVPAAAAARSLGAGRRCCRHWHRTCRSAKAARR